MRRGTTPQITIQVEGINLKDCDQIVLSFKQGNKLLNKNSDDMEISDDGQSLICKLTQQETLDFSYGSVKIQLKCKTVDGEVQASDIFSKNIEDILDESVME